MGKSSPQQQPLPDPKKIAQADAEANRITNITPWGSTLYLQRKPGGFPSGFGGTGGGGVQTDNAISGGYNTSPLATNDSGYIDSVPFRSLSGDPLDPLREPTHLSPAQVSQNQDIFQNLKKNSQGQYYAPGGGNYGDATLAQIAGSMGLQMAPSFDEAYYGFDGGDGSTGTGFGLAGGGGSGNNQFVDENGNLVGFDGVNIPEGYDVLGDQVVKFIESENQRKIRIAQERAAESIATGLDTRIKSLPTGEFDTSGFTDVPDYDLSQLGAAPGALTQAGLPGLLDFDISQLGDAPGMLSNAGLTSLLDPTTADRKRYEDAYMDRFNRMTDPIRNREEEQLRQSLANRGQTVGNAGFDREIELLYDAVNRGDADAISQAILAGGSEMQRDADLISRNRAQMFGERGDIFAAGEGARGNRLNELAFMGDNAARNRSTVFGERGAVVQGAEAQRAARERELLTRGNYGLAKRGQEFGEASFKRSLPWNELASAMSGSQIAMPSGMIPQVNVPNVDVAGIYGMTNAAANQRYGHQAALQASGNQALGNAASAAMMMAML